MRLRFFALFILSLSVFVAACGSDGDDPGTPDTTAPAAITDVMLVALTDSSGIISWTAPGDDGNVGTAEAYDVRLATETVTDANWDDAFQVDGEPTPQIAGSTETMEVMAEDDDSLLSVLATHETIYLAIRTVDDAGNWSELSNVLSVTPEHDNGDDTPPAVISDLTLESFTDSTATVSWTAPGDDGTDGLALAYDVRMYGETLTNANWGDATVVPEPPSPSTPGSMETMEIRLPELSSALTILADDLVTYIAVRTRDDGNNLADASNNVAVVRSTDAVVTIPDVNLLDEVRDALGIPSGDITVEDMLNLGPAFNVRGAGIADLSGLEFATNITSLDAGDNNVTLLLPLANMTQLVELRLDSNLFNSVSHLSNLTNLEHLNVRDNFLSNLGPLSNLTSLTALNVSENTALTDMGVVSNFTALDSLDASQTEISDLSPLQSLAAVSWVDLTETQVSDLSPLASNADFGSGDEVRLEDCPLSYESLDTHVGTLEGRGASVVLGPDVWAPPAIDDLAVSGVTDTSLTITWTSPGGGDLTSATEYDVRTRQGIIDEGSWPSSTQIDGEPAPSPYGSPDSMTIVFGGSSPDIQLSPAQDTYYVAIRSRDAEGNESNLSNVVMAELLDAEAPAQINIQFVAFTESSITIEWTSPGDDGYSGTAAAYEIRYDPDPITEENWESASVVANPPTPQPSFNTETFEVTGLATDVRYYIAVRARDEANNWSPVSNNVTAIPTAVTVVTFNDAALEAEIRDQLGIPSGDITTLDMATLLDVYASNSGISDLTGLEAAVNVEYVSLDDNNITDISALAGLTELVDLRLANNNISDLSPLEDLVKLEILYLSFNSITDVTPLADLAQVTTLYLHSCGLSNLSGLEGLHSIEYLTLYSNPITDLTPLSGLLTLKNLNLNGTDISNLGPLSALTNLEDLGVRDCNVSDLSPLAGLVNLIYLNAGANGGITDLSPLSGMTQLENLTLHGNSITSVAPLSGLTNITVLWLYSNDITDLSPLAGMTDMEQISLFGNDFTSLSALSGMTQLRRAFLAGNSFSDLEPLTNLTNMEELTLGSSQITDLSPLSGMTKLWVLRVNSTPLANLSPVANLTALKILDADYTSVVDISALESLPLLETVELFDADVVDLEPLVDNTDFATDDYLDVRNCPLSAESTNTHIPALEARGVTVDQ